MRRIIRRTVKPIPKKLPDKVVITNTITLLFDLEKHYGDISEMNYYFATLDMESGYCRPWMVRLTISGEQHRISLKEIVQLVGYIPIYEVNSVPRTGYGLVKNNGVVVNVSSEQVNPFLKILSESQDYYLSLYEDQIDDTLKKTVMKILGKIGGEFVEHPSGIVYKQHCWISCNTCIDSRYPVNIVATGVKDWYSPQGEGLFRSIGEFRVINSKVVSIPSSDHIALITTDGLVDWVTGYTI